MGNILPYSTRRRYAEDVRKNNERRKNGFDVFDRASSFEALVNDKRIKVPHSNAKELEDSFNKIVKLRLFELRDKLQNGELNAFTVLCAFVQAALRANERINCCTEVIKEAFDYAEAADDKWENSDDKPPLYGLPFSVKSNFYMKGYDCTIGVAKLLNQPKERDCPFMTHLMNLGAIPFVLTNVPQGFLSYACANTVYGKTLNPHDLTRTPGGSSGGEAALLAAGGTPFGTGSDLGGSMRIPAAFCGLVSLKPTQDRLVVTQTHGGTPGRGRFGLSFGFFTKSVDEQIFLLSLIIGSQEYRELVPQSSPAALRITKIEPKPGKKLKFGFFDDDGFTAPVPANRRVVIETIERLKAQGHEVVKFDVPRVLEAAQMFYKNVMPDNGAYMREIYKNEAIDPNMQQFVMALKIPNFIRWLLAKCVLPFISPQMALIGKSYINGIEDVRFNQEITDEYRLEIYTFSVPAVPHQYPEVLANAAFTTGLFNMLDFPAGVVPTGKVTSQDDVDLFNERLFPVGRNYILKQQREAAKNSVGLPISVQIVGLPFEEETCLQAMKIVETSWAES